MSEIEFQAGGLISTGRHLIEEGELKKYVGDKPTNPQAEKAWKETVDAFTQKNYSTEYHDGREWKTQENDFSDIYSGNFGDGYLSPDRVPGENDTALGFRTGVFVDGLRGVIQGTGYNDVIVTAPVNEPSEYAKTHMAAGAEKIKKGDAFYANVIEAQGGNDIVIAGRGDNYIIDATFVKVSASPNCDNFITTPEIATHGVGAYQNRGVNPKVYIDVKGGAVTMIDIPDEMDISKYNGTIEPSEVEALDAGWIDDFINCTSRSVGFSSNPKEGEYVGSAKQSALYKMNKDQVMLDANEMMGKIQETLQKEPEIDEAQIEATWDDAINQKTSLDDEMNGFFESMFGELNMLLGDAGLTEEDMDI
jgi:hypothetical protein